MEASESDIAKQKIEHEAREQKEQKPEPEPEPQPTHKIVQVLCGNCQAQFEFPVELNVQSFGFDCTNCGAHNEVEVPV